MSTLPDKLEIIPLRQPPTATIAVPGSKSITNRALVLAALTARQAGCRLTNVLRSEDTEVMVDCLTRLGFEVNCLWPESVVEIRNRSERVIPAGDAELFTANSGTTMRFLTALTALGQGTFRLDGVARMRERPIRDLLAALLQLGIDVRSERDNGCPPVIVNARGLPGGAVRIRGDVSSQFLSGLLMAAPFAANETAIDVDGPLVSLPYISMSVAMLRQFGLQVDMADDGKRFRIPGRQIGGRESFAIEPDASAASYFFAAAAICGGAVAVPGLDDTSLQGDVRFVELLQRMGCQTQYQAGGTRVDGGPLQGIDADMNDISDTVMTLAAVACFAATPTTIRNVAHIRHKETDRLAALAAELRRVGVGIEEFADGLTITPQPLHGAEIETYNDHRMAMSLALVGLRVPGIHIKNPGCVGKTYPHFFDDLEKLR